MFRAVLFIFSVGFAYGELRQWTLSADTYAAKVATLVTAKYDALVAEVETFKPLAEACSLKVNQTSDLCVACLDSVSCGDGSGNAFVEGMKKTNPAYWGPKLESELEDIANTIANGVETLYNKYGSGPIQKLSDGISIIGATFESIGSVIGEKLKAAFDKVKAAMTSLFEKFSDIFGKRRRRSIMMAEASLIREKRATLSDDEKACMSKCPDCSAFTSGDEVTATRAICGDTLVDAKIALEAKVAKVQAYYTDWETATQALIKDVYVDMTTRNIATATALKGGVYVTYDVSSANIAFDSWDQDPSYVALCAYIYTKY